MHKCETSGAEGGFEEEAEITFSVSYIILKIRSPSFTEHFGFIQGLFEA